MRKQVTLKQCLERDPISVQKGEKRCLHTAVGVIAFLDPWKKAQEEAPRRSLGDLTVLNMHFGTKHNFLV